MASTAPPILCKDKHGGTCRQPVAPPTYECRYTTHNIGRAHMYGRAGASVSGLGEQFGADRAKIGAKGEKIAQRVLWTALGTDPAVHIFNDVQVPTNKARINADFVIVRGNRLVVVDAKVWGKGFYWTLRGIPHRGWKFWEPFDGLTRRDAGGRAYTNRTVEWTCDLFREALASRPEKWEVRSAYLIVPPSKDPQAWRQYHMGLLRLHGAAKLIAGKPRTSEAIRAIVGTRPPQVDDLDVLRWIKSLTPSSTSK